MKMNSKRKKKNYMKKTFLKNLKPSRDGELGLVSESHCLK